MYAIHVIDADIDIERTGQAYRNYGAEQDYGEEDEDDNFIVQDGEQIIEALIQKTLRQKNKNKMR